MRAANLATLALAIAGSLSVGTAVSAQAQTQDSSAATAAPLPSWVDGSTDHKVMQLTGEPNSRSLYFNENAFTPGGKQMVYFVGQSIHVLDITTLKSRNLIDGPVTEVIVAHIASTVYFMRPKDTTLYAVAVDTGQIVKVATLPDNSTISSLNSDETLLAGYAVEGNGLDNLHHRPDPNLKASSVRAATMDERLSAHLPMVLFTLDLKTGEINRVLHSNDWINHVQFSPKDPHLLMYCHEGLWWKVDRIWTVRTDGTHNELIHKRTMDGEIAGHEFWDADGVTIWYDLQIPRGQNFYLASYNTDSGERHWYSVNKDDWSIHYNAASDDSGFCGDGGDYSQVAKSKNGQWIELFRLRSSKLPDDIDSTGLTKSGYLQSHHLVNMAKHDYHVEPNVRFSPDNKWVIFTGNMTGTSYVYAVEVAKADATTQTNQ